MADYPGQSVSLKAQMNLIRMAGRKDYYQTPPPPSAAKMPDLGDRLAEEDRKKKAAQKEGMPPWRPGRGTNPDPEPPINPYGIDKD